jgi:hypothetical protein
VAGLGIGFAKRVFQLPGKGEHGRAAVPKRVSRANLTETASLEHDVRQNSAT